MLIADLQSMEPDSTSTQIHVKGAGLSDRTNTTFAVPTPINKMKSRRAVNSAVENASREFDNYTCCSAVVSKKKSFPSRAIWAHRVVLILAFSQTPGLC